MLTQVHAQEMRSSRDNGVAPHTSSVRLAVCEPLWAIAVANGAAIDFYDLRVTQPEALGAAPFLCSFHGAASNESVAVVQLQLCPHDPSLLAAGTANGELVFLRLRRASSDGPLLVHQTLRTKHSVAADAAEPLPNPVQAISFHPTENLCAVVCGGTVRLLQHDIGLFAKSEACCAGASPIASIAWCGPLLACGEVGGVVRLWQLQVKMVEPSKATIFLPLNCTEVGVLPAPQSGSAASTASAACTMHWLAFDGSKVGDPCKADNKPVGVLCCGYQPAVCRAWRLHGDGQATLLANLLAAPLKGAASISAMAGPLTVGDQMIVHTDDSQGLVAQSFRAQTMQWLLCGSSSATSIFALPCGCDAADDAQSSIRFPTPTELLRVPALQLTPTPNFGVRGIHPLASRSCVQHVNSALRLTSTEHSEILLVLSDVALHVVSLTEAAPKQAVQPALEPSMQEIISRPVLVPPPERVTLAPLVAHMLPVAPRHSPETLVQSGMHDHGPKGGGAKASPVTTARDGAVPSPPPSIGTVALLKRIESLEARAIGAEARLAELQTSFALFADESRKQTNVLLAALENLTCNAGRPATSELA
jgi:hypothetical protein